MPVPKNVFGIDDTHIPNCPLPDEDEEPDESEISHTRTKEIAAQPEAPETD